MAQVTLWGASYSDVPAVELPKTGGGTARFDDTSDADATADDIVSGKTAYVNGAKLTGTMSGNVGSVTQDENGYIVLDDEAPPEPITVDPLSVTANGTYTATNGHAYSPVTVNVSGGGSKPRKQINFIDYDGTILHSYTSTEWQSVSTLPDNPTHDGLTSQGWNWTKTQIDNQLTALPDGDVWVGQMYVTTSGATEIDLDFTDCDMLSPYLSFAVNGTVTVDWGDNSATSTVTGTSLTSGKSTKHTFPSKSKYTVKISVVSGQFSFTGADNRPMFYKNTSYANQNRAYMNCVKAVRVGDNARIGSYSFVYCEKMEYVTLPSYIPGFGQYAFNYCTSMGALVVPNGITGTAIESYCFSNCAGLSYISLPSELTSIATYMFEQCRVLKSVTIPYNVTSIGSNAFRICSCIHSLSIPNTVTTLNSYAFYSCQTLTKVNIPTGITSITQYLFGSVYPLTNVTIPSGVTSIAANSFNGCAGLVEIHLLPSTPPTLANTNAFGSIPSDCKIYVPSASLNTYKTTSNWSSYASYMVGE